MTRKVMPWFVAIPIGLFLLFASRFWEPQRKAEAFTWQAEAAPFSWTVTELPAPDRPKPPAPITDPYDGYKAAIKEAKAKQDIWVAVWIGQPVPDPERRGLLQCSVPSLTGYPPVCLAMFYSQRGEIYHYRCLEGKRSDAGIDEACKPWQEKAPVQLTPPVSRIAAPRGGC